MKGLGMVAAAMTLGLGGGLDKIGKGWGYPTLGPGRGKFWDKGNRVMKMKLNNDELNFLANSGGRIKKLFVKSLKLKYGVR